MFITCKLCPEYLYRVYVMLCYVMLCYTMLCYVMVGCCAVPCPKNISAQSDPVSFCASDNKRLVTCNTIKAGFTPFEVFSGTKAKVKACQAETQEVFVFTHIPRS